MPIEVDHNSILQNAPLREELQLYDKVISIQRLPDQRLVIDNKRQYIRKARQGQRQLTDLNLSIRNGPQELSKPELQLQNNPPINALDNFIIPRQNLKGLHRRFLKRSSHVTSFPISERQDQIEVIEGDISQNKQTQLSVPPTLFNPSNFPRDLSYKRRNSKLIIERNATIKDIHFSTKTSRDIIPKASPRITRNNTILLPKVAVATDIEITDLIEHCNAENEKNNSPLNYNQKSLKVKRRLKTRSIKRNKQEPHVTPAVDTAPSHLFLTDIGEEKEVYSEDEREIIGNKASNNLSSLNSVLSKRQVTFQNLNESHDINYYKGMAKLPTRLAKISVGQEVPMNKQWKKQEHLRNSLLQLSKSRADEKYKKHLTSTLSLTDSNNYDKLGENGTRWQSASTMSSYKGKSKTDVGGRSLNHISGDGNRQLQVSVATIKVNYESADSESSKFNFAMFRHKKVRKTGSKEEHLTDDSDTHTRKTRNKAHRFENKLKAKHHCEFKVVEEANISHMDGAAYFNPPQNSPISYRSSSDLGTSRPNSKAFEKSLSYLTYEKAYVEQERINAERFRKYIRAPKVRRPNIVEPDCIGNDAARNRDKMYNINLPFLKDKKNNPEQTHSADNTRQRGTQREPSYNWSPKVVATRHHAPTTNKYMYASEPDLSHAALADNLRGWFNPPPTPFVPVNPPPSAASWHLEPTSSRHGSPQHFVNRHTPIQAFGQF